MKLYILAIFFFLAACGDKKEGILFETFPDGARSAEIPYTLNTNGDTIINGTIKYFYHNGKIQDQFDCINGKKCGWYFQYDSLGRLNVKTMFRNNKAWGYSFIYDTLGKVQLAELNLNDSVVMKKSYFQNGRLYVLSVFSSKTDVKYYVIYDSLGKIMDESGSFNPKDTLFYLNYRPL